jgi:acetylornithine/succinyldiaminopimelate/putrescine aminotransferase/predicted amino acid dehydrogenase
MNAYQNYCRPSLMQLLTAVGLDVAYVQSHGDWVFRREPTGGLRPVLDMVGGYGVNLLGHGHSELVSHAQQLLAARVTGFVQASIRTNAGALAEALVDVLGPHYVIFTNSGAETVEAAIKHAHLETGRRRFWALKGAFHGKTVGAIQLTESYCDQFSTLGPPVRFLDPNDPASLQAAAAEAHEVAALFIEPIQGEGGVRGLAPAFVEWAKQICAMHDIPIVADEIQTGMGRTGSWLASTELGLDPAYICLGKALGGGLAKIGALLVKRERFVHEFSKIHTSTFAEDDWSCGVALRALEIARRDDVAGRCRAAGAKLLAKLRSLQADYPEQIKEIRGRGLLVGIELLPLHDQPSAILQMLSEQEHLGYFAAAYLLQEHDVRVLPTMSNPMTLRVEPSAYIRDEELDRFVEALRCWCRAVRAVDMAHVTRHYVGLSAGPVQDHSTARRFTREHARTRRRVGFIGHLATPEDVISFDPSMRNFGNEHFAPFLERCGRILEPTICHSENIRSLTGEEVHVSFIGLSMTAPQIMQAIADGDSQWMVAKIELAAELARDVGCDIIGFGGHTSILTRNCQSLRIDGVALTSGNSLTVGLGVRAMQAAAARKQIRLCDAKLGIIGAAGNIGSAYATSIAPHVREVVLVVRHMSKTVEDLRAEIVRCAPSTKVTVTRNPDRLRECALIVTASNSGRPILKAEHVSEEACVICDIAVPSDVAPCVYRDRPLATVFQGGLARLPLNPELQLPGMHLPPGHVFACLGETLLMGLEGARVHGSYGALTPQGIEHALYAADRHGFSASEAWTPSAIRASAPRVTE